MSQSASAVDDLASLIGRDDATVVREELMMMKHRLGPDRAIRVAQHLSSLGPEAIRHLIQESSVEANCIAEDDMVNEALSTFETPTIVVPTQNQIVPTASRLSNHSSKQSHPGRLASVSRSKSDVSRPSKPEKLNVTCKRRECAQHTPFKSLRGLREHFVMKHAMPIDWARQEAESAFKLGNETLPQPQHLEPPGGSFATARTQVQNDEARSMTDRQFSGFAAEQAPFRMSMSPNNAGGQLPETFPRAQQFALQEYRNSVRPDIQAYTTSSFHPGEGVMPSENIAIDMPANLWPNYHNHWSSDLFQSPGQPYSCTPSVEIQSDIDVP